MDPETVEQLIEDGIEGATATVSNPRNDGEHFEAVVVASAFEEMSLVDQHKLVYDALDDRMTTDVHALELKTYTPGEAPDS